MTSLGSFEGLFFLELRRFTWPLLGLISQQNLIVYPGIAWF